MHLLHYSQSFSGLDLRYNDLTDVGVRHVATFLQVPKCFYFRSVVYLAMVIFLWCIGDQDCIGLAEFH